MPAEPIRLLRFTPGYPNVLSLSFSLPFAVDSFVQFYTLAVPVPPDSPDDPPAENPFGLPSEYSAVLQERCVACCCPTRRPVAESEGEAVGGQRESAVSIPMSMPHSLAPPSGKHHHRQVCDIEEPRFNFDSRRVQAGRCLAARRPTYIPPIC